MALQNKLNISDSAELAREEEKMQQHDFDSIVEKYVEMNVAHPFREGNGRSPIKDIEIKYLLKQALTDKVNDREVYRKGINASNAMEIMKKTGIHQLYEDLYGWKVDIFANKEEYNFKEDENNYKPGDIIYFNVCLEGGYPGEEIPMKAVIKSGGEESIVK